MAICNIYIGVDCESCSITLWNCGHVFCIVCNDKMTFLVVFWSRDITKPICWGYGLLRFVMDITLVTTAELHHKHLDVKATLNKRAL